MDTLRQAYQQLLATMTQQQEQLRNQFATLGHTAGMGTGMGGMGAYEDQIRQNLALFDRAMKMFSHFAFAKTGEAVAPAPTPAAAAGPKAEPAQDDAVAELRKRMEEMQAQIEKLASKS